jgi:flagellin-like protein
MKKIWTVRRDAEAVSPVIATILMVAITVVLAAVLYVMVLGFGGNTNVAPTLDLSRSNFQNGYKMTCTAPTEDVGWGDVTIQLNGISWSNFTATDLTTTTGDAAEWTYGSGRSVNGVSVWLNITDVGGNGKINGGDFFTMTYGGVGWTSGTDYAVTMLYGDDVMGTEDWTG